MERGEVWWANLPSPLGRRPVVLLTRNEAYGYRTSVTVAPVTTTIRRIRVEVRLTTADGLPRECVVNLDDVQTIPKAHLTDRIVSFSFERMAAIEAALRYALAIP